MRRDILEAFCEMQECASLEAKMLQSFDGGKLRGIVVRHGTGCGHQEQTRNTACVRDIRAFRKRAGLCVRCGKSSSGRRECLSCSRPTREYVTGLSPVEKLERRRAQYRASKKRKRAA